MAIGAIGVVTVGVVLATPDTPVPFVSGDLAQLEEARRSLAEAGDLLADEPETTLSELQRRWPLVVGVEGREPSGVFWALVAAAVGTLGALAWTRRGNGFGVHLITLAATTAVFGLARAAIDLDVHSTMDLPARNVVAAAADSLWIAQGVILTPLLILTFPNGRFVGRRWRGVMWMAGLAAILLATGLGWPYQYDGRVVAPHAGFASPVFEPGLALWMGTIAIAAVSLLVRLRMPGEERAAVAWVAWGLGIALVTSAVADVARALGGSRAWWDPIQAGGFFVVVPAAFLVAVLRYRLFDIGIVIRRSFIFSVLSAIVAGAYVTVLAGAGRLFGRGVWSAVAAATVAALVVEPARRWLVAGVDRLVHGRRASPYAALSGFSDRLAQSYSLEDGLDALVRAVAAGTGARDVAIWVISGSDHVLAAASGDRVTPPPSPSDPDAAPVVPIGEEGLVVLRLHPGQTLRGHERTLLADLAGTAEHLLGGVRLRRELSDRVDELQCRRDELEQSRQEVERVIEETRLAVERDLHDGAQASLVSVGIAIGMARTNRDAITTDDLRSRVDRAHAECVRFARGLDPPDLAEEGPAFAVTRSVDHSDVSLGANAGPFPPEAASALYLMGMEAVQNALKHAPGCPVVVSSSTDDALRLTVADSGPGIGADEREAGRGFANMRARLEALGGSLRVVSRAGSGTVVEGIVP